MFQSSNASTLKCGVIYQVAGLLSDAHAMVCYIIYLSLGVAPPSGTNKMSLSSEFRVWSEAFDVKDIPGRNALMLPVQLYSNSSFRSAVLVALQ